MLSFFRDPSPGATFKIFNSQHCMSTDCQRGRRSWSGLPGLQPENSPPRPGLPRLLCQPLPPHCLQSLYRLFFGVCLFLPDSASRALTHTPWPSSLPDCFIHNGYKYPPASKHQLNQVCHSTDALGASLCAQPHVGWRLTLSSSENIRGWETQGDQET